jgi:hypothetical protein
MSLVIDANAANTLSAAGCEASKAIIVWVRKGGQVISGGKLQRELLGTNLRFLLSQWSAAGRLRILDADLVNRTEAELEPQCRSNDSHVVAVLKIGDAKVLVSGDTELHRDVKDATLMGYRRKIITCDQGTFSDIRIVRALLRGC